ncbi:LysM peptidoglycan-binding domain-containing protein [Solidesulfovibrio sp.]
MLQGTFRLPVFVLLAGLALVFAAGCSKYDGLERNMQYVSDDLLRKDAEVSWRQVNEAHAAWTAAGSSHDKGDAAFAGYEDAYGRYAVIYNELWDRQKNPFSGHLRAATDALPPPPPGVSVPAAAPKAAPAAPGETLPGPGGRTLNDPAPAASAPDLSQSAPAPRPAAASKPVPAPAPNPVPAASAQPAGPGRYVIQSGDTLYSIAKRHGISEKRLMEANAIVDPRKIAAGKTLTIPAP